MAVPGYSVTDLINALGQAKQVYDAFFDKNKNSASQIKQLAEDIEEFRANLQTHKDIVERHGLEYSGYKAVSRTLTECYEFLDKYQSAIDKRFSAVGAFRTTRFAFVQDDVARLRGQIARHGDSVLLHSVNIVLDNSLRNGSVAGGTTSATQPLPIQYSSPSSVPPVSSPALPFQSPTFTSNGFLSTSPSAGGFSPRMGPQPSNISGRSLSPLPSPTLSPRSDRGARSRQSTVDSLVLPQQALLYTVATIFFESKKIELKRKPIGRNFIGGREFVIVDEFVKPRFTHKIKLAQNQPCYPFTWHRRWEDHDLEVTFKGTAPENHSLVFKGQLAGSGIPRYKFSHLQDYKEFQSQVRGKDLVSSFNIRQIKSGSSTKRREATDQHLKIWRDRINQDHSISFYASAAEKPCDLEFPVSMFKEDMKLGDEQDVEISFAVPTESSSKRKMSRPFSRSATEKSGGSVSGQGIFSRTQTGMTATTAATTVLDSGMSIASFESDSSFNERRKVGSSSLEVQAKQMKCLSIKFSDAQDAFIFRAEFQRIYKEDVARPLDYLLEWQLDSAQQPGSVASGASESGTPTRQLAASPPPTFELHSSHLVEMGADIPSELGTSIGQLSSSPAFELHSSNLVEMGADIPSELGTSIGQRSPSPDFELESSHLVEMG